MSIEVICQGLGRQQLSIYELTHFYTCENKRIPDYFKNMFLTHDNTRRLKRIRWAPQRFNKMETNLPNNNNYEIKVKHTNSKYCRFCIRHEIPKLIEDNYLPGEVLEKINTQSYSGFVHYAQNYIISKYESIIYMLYSKLFIGPMDNTSQSHYSLIGHLPGILLGR